MIQFITRPPDKGRNKDSLLLSLNQYILWVFKRRFFRAPKHMFKLTDKKITVFFALKKFDNMDLLIIALDSVAFRKKRYQKSNYFQTSKYRRLTPLGLINNPKEALTNSVDPKDVHNKATSRQSLYCLPHSQIKTISGDCINEPPKRTQ